MSKNIFETEKIQVTAYVGKNGAACVQIGMKGDFTYEQLEEEQVKELRDTLTKRLQHRKGFRATD